MLPIKIENADLEKPVNRSSASLFGWIFFALAAALWSPATLAQNISGGPEIDYRNPREYEIAGISVNGAVNFDTEAIILFSGLTIGEKITIPGEKTTQAIKNLWKQKLFSDIQIAITEQTDDKVYLAINLEERPRLSKFKFEGVSKSEAESLRDKINLIRGTIVNENLLTNTENIIRKHFVEKGFLDTEVNIEDNPDTTITNSVYLIINVDKNSRVKVDDIVFEGVDKLSERKLRKAMKKTKEKRWWRFWSRSKFIRSQYKEDKARIIDAYNREGFRNAKIVSDSVYRTKDEDLKIKLNIFEGDRFYFGNITWTGNTKYSSERLSEILAIEPGEIYNSEKFESHLYMNPRGGDVSSLYLDDGYLAFQAIPIEKRIYADTVDIEIRIYEGRQYRINQVFLSGNTKTNDRVIIREIRTKPGDLFSRSEIIRTQRELAQLGYFDPEGFQVQPVQNDQEGTVDIYYTVVERPSDQIELSGGWGAGTIVGTLGLSFSNFSIRNFFNADAWKPLPSGDGQRLSLRAQSNGTYYQAYNMSFTEPWLGGKKPNSFTVGLQRSVQTNGVSKKDDREGTNMRRSLSITGGSVSLGTRLAWPDDYFLFSAGISYLYYDINNYSSSSTGNFAFSNGYSNNLALLLNFSRSSIFDPIYPRYGSNIKLNVKLTPPWSAFDNVDYTADISSQKRYKMAEYYKWKFVVEWYTELAPKLVLLTRSGFGYLGFYNADKGLSPFERFYLGGSALSGFALDGREIIGLRGYDDLSLSPDYGAPIISKQTLELRYPISLNPSATIYALSFVEAGNTYDSFSEFNPFRLYRSAGIGLRIFMPMFGLMGLDYGWRLDDVSTAPNMPRSQFHFTIGVNFGEL